MRGILILAATLAGVTGVQAQTTSEELCETTGAIVTRAQELRVSGSSSADTVALITEDYADRSDAFKTQAIPMLVDGFVYAQPEEVLDQDLAAAWKETCLATDLSSVLPAD